MLPESYFDRSLSPLTVLRRHRFAMALTFLAVVVLTLLYTAVSPTLYTSEAKVFVRLGHESVSLDPTATTGQTIALQDSRENEINTVYELFKSRAVIEDVVDALGTNVILGKAGAETQDQPIERPSIWMQLNPLATYSLRDNAIRSLSKRLHVDLVRKTSIINLSCDAPSPELARQVVQKAIECARDMQLRVNRTDGSFDFFASQLKQQEGALTQSEDELRDLKSSSGVAAVSTQREVFIRRVAGLEDDRLKSLSEIEALRAEMAARRRVLQSTPATQISEETKGMPQTAAARMREQLYALELRDADLSSRFQEQSSVVQEVREQIVKARALLAQEHDPTQTTTSKSATYQQTELALLDEEARVTSLEAQVHSLDQQLADARETMRSFNDDELRIVRLERQIELGNVNFRKYAENLESARIDQALQDQSISNLNVLQAPTHSFTPSRPRVILNLSLGLVLAVFSAVAVAGMSEIRHGGREVLAGRAAQRIPPAEMFRADSALGRHDLAGTAASNGNGHGQHLNGHGS